MSITTIIITCAFVIVVVIVIAIVIVIIVIIIIVIIAAFSNTSLPLTQLLRAPTMRRMAITAQLYCELVLWSTRPDRTCALKHQVRIACRDAKTRSRLQRNSHNCHNSHDNLCSEASRQNADCKACSSQHRVH